MQTVAITPQSVQEKVDTINSLALDLYSNASRNITPAKGWVLVRVLPKEQQRNGIWLPDGKVQNKPIFEALVLCTYAPYEVTKSVTDETGRRLTKTTLVSPQVQQGDHVFFEHYAGVPLDTDQKLYSDYRLVREEYNPNEGGIIGVIDYDEAYTKPHNLLVDLITSVLADSGAIAEKRADQLSSLLAAKIENEFFLGDKNKKSVTLSGR